MRSHSYTRAERLTEGGDFKRLLRNARRRSNQTFTVCVAENPNGNARLGLAIGRRASPRAVDRNKIKRIVREYFRINKTQLTGYDVLVLAQPAIGRQSPALLRARLHELLKT